MGAAPRSLAGMLALWPLAYHMWRYPMPGAATQRGDASAPVILLPSSSCTVRGSIAHRRVLQLLHRGAPLELDKLALPRERRCELGPSGDVRELRHKRLSASQKHVLGRHRAGTVRRGLQRSQLMAVSVPAETRHDSNTHVPVSSRP